MHVISRTEPGKILAPASVTVGVTAVPIPDPSDPKAISLTIANFSGDTIHLGGSGVTTTTGLPLPTGTMITISAGKGSGLYLIGPDAGNDVRYAWWVPL